MKAGYKGLTVRSVMIRHDGWGPYISQCVFLLDKKAAAVYSEPRELSVYPYCSDNIHPYVRFTSSIMMAETNLIAAQYIKERPYAVSGRTDDKHPVLKMFSDISWTAAMIKNAESGWRSRTYEYCGNIAYIDISKNKDRQHILSIFPDDDDLKDYLDGDCVRVIAYSDKEHIDHIMPDMPSVLIPTRLKKN